MLLKDHIIYALNFNVFIGKRLKRMVFNEATAKFLATARREGDNRLRLMTDLSEPITEACRKTLPIVHVLFRNGAHPKLWQHWGAQRYLAASGFLDFLRNTREGAEKAGLENITREIAKNIRDEEGYVATGSHEEWRQWFYSFLGWDEDTLAQNSPTGGSEKLRWVSGLLQSDTTKPWYAIGGLLFMELFIGEEMKILQKGIENSPWMQEKLARMNEKEARRATLYVDHHAMHDTDQHYDDLFRAVMDDAYTLPPEELDSAIELMQLGITVAEGGRNLFYTGLFSSPDYERIVFTPVDV